MLTSIDILVIDLAGHFHALDELVCLLTSLGVVVEIEALEEISHGEGLGFLRVKINLFEALTGLGFAVRSLREGEDKGQGQKYEISHVSNIIG